MIESMKQWLNPWFERINARTLRERVLILAVVIGVLVFVVDTYVWLPTRDAIASREQAIQRLQTEYLRLQARYDTLQHEAKRDPNVALRTTLADLKPEIEKIRQELGEQVAQLISPQQMNTVLRAMVDTQQGLRLASLQSLAPQEIALGNTDTDATNAEQNDLLRVYRRGVDLTLQGSFHALVAYLDMLEDLPWVLGWDWLHLSGEDYPISVFHLRLYTLSIDQEWLRV